MKSHAIANLEAAPEEAFFRRIGELAEAGIDVVQLRAKTLDARTTYDAAVRIRALLRPPAQFVVNRRADVALAAGADGVHLPSDGLPAGPLRRIAPQRVIGRSCHTLEEVKQAKAEGCDYVLLGPVFAPRSKPGRGAVTTAQLHEASRHGIEVFALGGISRDNLQALSGSGIAGVAAVTLFMSDGPVAAIVEDVRAS
jgi:thiamine-phosphate pyrophosphorylase